MLKRILVLFATMLIIAACGSVEYGDVSCISYEADTLVEVDVPSFTTPAPTSTATPTPLATPTSASYAYENVPLQTDLHPFASALQEYIEDYDGVVRAFLVTLDDSGTIGVLASRTPTKVLIDYDMDEYGYRPAGTIFFMQDGDVFQIDGSGLFVSGRYNRLMSRSFTHTHVVEFIYKLELGRLEISTLLNHFSNEYISYLLGGSNDVVAEFIAERDAHIEYIRDKYGLVALLSPSFGHMRNTQDQTEQILGLTINCVPAIEMIVTTTRLQTDPDQISIVIGDTPINFAFQQPIRKDGHVLVPVHEFFELLGFCVRWHPPTQQVRLLGETRMIVVAFNNDSDAIAGDVLDVPLHMIDDSIMIPVCFILERVGYSVQWDEVTQTAIFMNLGRR